MPIETQLLIFAHILLSATLGSVIGFEREISGKPAGLRTHLLAAAAASLIVSLAQSIGNTFDTIPTDALRIDPIRSIEAVVVGISFIGAGTIFFHRSANTIEGLTTAASILTVAAIGIAVALHAYYLAIATTVFTFATLFLVGKLEARLEAKRRSHSNLSNNNANNNPSSTNSENIN